MARLLRLPRRAGLVFLFLAILSLGGSLAYGFYSLPSIEQLELQPIAASQVFDIHNRLIAKLFEENRIVVPLSEISPYLQQAVIANEDVRFYSHWGIDPVGIARAIWVDLTTGGVVEGGSTITQQLAKNMFLTQERTIGRKIKEALLAILIETKFSKQEILQAYLNQVYFGANAYGAEAAAQAYFGTTAKDLTLGQSALMAGVLRGPNIYSPYVSVDAALKRREAVLDGMVKAGYISPQEADKARREKIVLVGAKRRNVQASYFLDFIANQLVQRYGPRSVYRGGLKIYTTLDLDVQKAAENALGEYQGAVLAVDPRSGHIRAMVGGRNYAESQTNRVFTQTRQPGSAFKPFVYTVALAKGMTAATIVEDRPMNIHGYAPKNYNSKYLGPVTLKTALSQSINSVAVQLANQVGIEEVLNLARQMGISTLMLPEDANLAAALGGLTKGVTLFEMVTAYTAFAANGVLAHPIAVLKVYDDRGALLNEFREDRQAVISPEIAYIMTDMMQDVIARGTGTAAAINRPAAGKTGTTDNNETAWFIGYTPELLTGVFLGNDDHTPIGISGGEAARIWGNIMRSAMAGTPVLPFVAPPGVITGVPVCATTGMPPGPDCPRVEYSAFIQGTEPTATSKYEEKKSPPSSFIEKIFRGLETEPEHSNSH